MTLPETLAPSARFKLRLLEALPHQAARLGWSEAALAAAARDAGLSEGERMLAAPGGVMDMIDAFIDQADQHMLERLGREDLLRLKVRERVTLAVRARLEAQAPHKQAVAKLAPWLALPGRLGQGPKLVWRTADRIWRALGDTSTDGNFYSKRAILSGVLASTYAKWLIDDEEGYPSTLAFLDDRIANVMQFEKLKARFKPLGEFADQAAAFAARARYGRAD